MISKSENCGEINRKTVRTEEFKCVVGLVPDSGTSLGLSVDEERNVELLAGLEFTSINVGQAERIVSAQ